MGRKNKIVLIVGAVSFAMLFILSQLYYLERTAFYDLSFHLFHLLREGTFQIQNFRYGAFVSQLFPLFAYYMGFSLETAARMYSGGFVVYNFILFLLCILWIKDYRYALIILFLNTFMTAGTFYWIQSEFLQGLPMLVFYFGLLDKYKESLFNSLYDIPSISMILFIFFLNFYHPLGVFPFLYMCVYFLIDKNKRSRPYLLSMIFYIGFFVFKSWYFSTSYDRSAINGLSDISQHLPNIFTIGSSLNFYTYILEDYYFLLIGFLGMLAYYVWRKQYLKPTLLLLSFLGYTAMININYFWGSDQFYMENQYMALCVFVVVPLIFDVLSRLNINYFIAVVAFIVIVRLIHIQAEHTEYTDRLNWLRQFMQKTEKYEHKKLIVSDAVLPMDLLYMTWATPYEFWLLSMIETGKSRSILCTDKPDKWQDKMEMNKVFLGTFGWYPYSALSGQYFIFRDTSQYQLIRTEEDFLKLNTVGN